MTEEEYVEKAFQRLPTIEDPNDIPYVNNCLKQCYQAKFTLDDAVQFTRLTEHVDPTLDEDVACRRMAEIAQKYMEPKG